MAIVHIDWSMVSALGTWAGSLATFLAVVVSLRHARSSFIPRLYAVLEYKEGVHKVDGGVFSNLLTTFVIENRGVATAKMNDLIIRDNRTWRVSTIPMSMLAGFELGQTVPLDSGSRFQAKFLPVTSLVRIEDVGRLGRIREIVLGPCSIWISTPLGKSYRVKMSKCTKQQISSFILHQHDASRSAGDI